MNKLPSFKYNNMIFHNVKGNLFQTDRFGDKLIYKHEKGKYYLVKDERLNSTFGANETSHNNSISNDDYLWD